MKLSYKDIIQINLDQAKEKMGKAETEEERKYWLYIMKSLARDYNNYKRKQQWKRRRTIFPSEFDKLFREFFGEFPFE